MIYTISTYMQKIHQLFQLFVEEFPLTNPFSKTMPDPEDSGGVGDAQHGVRRMMSCF